MKNLDKSLVLWEPESAATSHSMKDSCPQLAELVVVTNAEPITNKGQRERMFESPPTSDIMAKMLTVCPLTADHFRLSVPILGTFAVWMLSQEGNHYIVIPARYGGPEGNFAVSRDSDKPSLNLVNSLAQLLLKRSIPPDSVRSCTMLTTHGNFTVYAFGIPVRCDVCGRPVEKYSGFTLSAKQIVSTPHYWRLRYERNEAHWSTLGVSSFDQYRSSESIRDAEVQTILRLGGDWLVCDGCIVHFAADREVARHFATAWWMDRNVQHPDDWAATPSDVNMG